MRQPAPTSLPEEMRALASAARDAARELSRASTEQKDEALRAAADALAKRSSTDWRSTRVGSRGSPARSARWRPSRIRWAR